MTIGLSRLTSVSLDSDAVSLPDDAGRRRSDIDRRWALPRYLAVAWPFDWVLAGRRSRIGRSAVLATFALLHVAALWLAFTWQTPP
jgi:hypothetical protein